MEWKVQASRTRDDRRIFFDWRSTDGAGIAYSSLTPKEALALAAALRAEAEWVCSLP